MFNIKIKRLLVAAFLCVSFSVCFADETPHSPEEILAFADANRLPWNSVVVDAAVADELDGEPSRIYTILSKNFTKTLIAVRGPISNKGDLVLMTNDGLWFYLRKTKKPIRITPIQKLTGSVSYGDVARISWSSDYQVNEVVENPEIPDDQSILNSDESLMLLKLQAKTKSATYHKIDLWVTAEDYTPRKADVYLLSGKLFKTLEFVEYVEIDDKKMNVKLKIVDQFQKEGTSYVTFSNPRPTELPDRLFLKTGLQGVTLESIGQY